MAPDLNMVSLRSNMKMMENKKHYGSVSNLQSLEVHLEIQT